MNNYKFTYIIGYRHSMDRYHNLLRVIDWLHHFNNIEIILIEQDTHSKIKHINLGNIKYIFTKSNMPYNRSHAFNVGLKNATTDIIVFGDSDLIMDYPDLINSISLLQDYDMVSPYKKVIDLEQDESRLPIENMLLINRPGRGDNDNQKLNICGGISIFRKSSIENIAGWNEDFIGWGGEDDFQAIKVKNFLKYHETDYKCYHLYHTKAIPDALYYRRNLQILQNVSKYNIEQLSRLISIQRNKIGKLNRYDNF